MRPAARATVCALAITCAGGLACAPLATFRNPGAPAPAGHQLEVGLGGVALGPRPYVDEPWRVLGQAWLSKNLSRRVALSTVVAADQEAVAVGGALLWRFVHEPRWVLGAEIEAGWLWAALAVPVAVRMFGNTWLYAAPRFGNVGHRPTVGLPAGLSVGLGDTWSIRVEVQVSWTDLEPYNRRVHLGAALVRAF